MISKRAIPVVGLFKSDFKARFMGGRLFESPKTERFVCLSSEYPTAPGLGTRARHAALADERVIWDGDANVLAAPFAHFHVRLIENRLHLCVGACSMFI